MTNRTAAMLCIGAAAALAAGCSDAVVGPNNPVPCEVEAVIPAASIAHVTAGQLAIAIEDAATRIAPTIPAEAGGPELRAALATVMEDPADADAGCRASLAVRTLLEDPSNHRASIPDRAVLSLVLDLMQSYNAAFQSTTE